MPPSDAEVRRAARLWIQQYGFLGAAKAREKVDELRRRGDEEGADLWLRIVAAIAAMRATA